jgi:hypothetical protein
MTQVKIVSVKSITPKKQMANLKKIAKEFGRNSSEYKDCLTEMSKVMLSTLDKLGV